MQYLTLFTIALCLVISSCNNTVVQQEDKADSVAARYADNPYATALVPLTGNKDMGRVLCQNWQMQEDVEMLASLNEPQGMIPVRSLNLFADSTFTQNIRNFMEYGHWWYNAGDKKIYLKYHNGDKAEYKLAALATDELIVVNTGIDSETKLTYVADGKSYTDISNDPFHISNNQWRIKPRQPETELQLRQRLKQFLWFHVLLYRDNLAREEKVISFYGFPTCLKWYAGGIFIIKKEDLPANWYGCFYNKEQALKAYAIMDDIIGKKYNWPKEKISWVKKNLSVLEQMYANL